MDRIVFHIDVNSAYLSWEAVARLKAGETVDLREIPAAVGGDIETRHGVILAKSIPAKKYGVTTGEPVVDALRKCPDLTLVKPHHQMYREQSHAFIAILQQYSDVIEQFSVDEAFVDMTGSGRLFGTPVEAAHRIRKQIYEELGFTVSTFITRCKLEEARRLLQYTNKPLSVISNYLCFSSQSHFQNTFKKKFGVTPLQYRKNPKKS